MPLKDEDIRLLYKTLRNIEFFSDLSINEMDLLISGLRTERYSKGKLICKQGETGDCLYIISKGNVTVWIDKGGFSKKLVATLGSGQFFGEMALLDDQTRKANIVTDTRCEFHVLYRSRFWEILMNNPAIQDKINKISKMRKMDSEEKKVEKQTEEKSPSWLMYRLKRFF